MQKFLFVETSQNHSTVENKQNYSIILKLQKPQEKTKQNNEMFKVEK